MTNFFFQAFISRFCSGIAVFFVSCSIFAQSDLKPPEFVSALLYSPSTAELFWKPGDYPVPPHFWQQHFRK